MKLIKLKILIIFILTSSLALAAPESKGSKRKGGWRESYGGDSAISEFRYISRELEDTIISIYNIDIDYKKFIDEINIECKDSLILNGVEKDAINYPYESPPRLELNCTKWKNFINNSFGKKTLVAHELSHLLGFDDSTYSFSNHIIMNFVKNFPKSISVSKEMLSFASDCNVNEFRDTLLRGADVYFEDENGANVKSHAVLGYCNEIYKIAQDYGVPLKLEGKFSLDLIKLELDYLILRSSSYMGTLEDRESYIKNLNQMKEILSLMIQDDNTILDTEISFRDSSNNFKNVRVLEYFKNGYYLERSGKVDVLIIDMLEELGFN